MLGNIIALCLVAFVLIFGAYFTKQTVPARTIARTTVSAPAHESLSASAKKPSQSRRRVRFSKIRHARTIGADGAVTDRAEPAFTPITAPGAPASSHN